MSQTRTQTTTQTHNIPFNKPYMSGNEAKYIVEAVNSGKISGNGIFTKKCHEFFKTKYGFANCLLTTSCTDALEMASILCNIEPGDEIILPSYTFVSTANAFVLRGANLIFADSKADHPNLDANILEPLITSKTKAIVVVHYAGIACDMVAIQKLCKKHKIFLIEDAAQAIDAYYRNKPLGSFGDFATFSFHETKNIIAGEGGMLVINNEEYVKRAEIIWEKGTNRAAFFRGEINKYGWVDIGSSFLPSELISAFLYAQLQELDDIQRQRLKHYDRYQEQISEIKQSIFSLPGGWPNATRQNAHMFYLVFDDLDIRSKFIAHMRANGIHAVFHYLSLHKSVYYKDKHQQNRALPNCDRFADTLVRLPLFYELTESEQDYIVQKIREFVEMQ